MAYVGAALDQAAEAGGTESTGSSAVASAGGSAIGGGGGIKLDLNPLQTAIMEIGGTFLTNALNRQNMQDQIDQQNWASGTAHQREVMDLKRAGLNPILSATGGSGSSTPQGAMFTAENPFRGLSANLLSGAQRILSNAQTAKVAADTDNVRESTRTLISQQALNSAQQIKELSQADLNDESAQAVKARAGLDIMNSNLSNAQKAKVLQETESLKYDNLKKKTMRSLYGPAGDALEQGIETVKKGGISALWEKLFPPRKILVSPGTNHWESGRSKLSPGTNTWQSGALSSPGTNHW